MLTYAQIGQAAVLLTLLILALMWGFRRPPTESPAATEPVTREEPAPAITEMLERVAALEIVAKKLQREHDDLNDSVDHRFRRLNARSKREEPADTEPNAADETLPLPFGAATGAGFGPAMTGNGRRPFGSRGSFGPNGR